MPFEMDPFAIPAGLHSFEVERVASDVGEMWLPMLDHVMRDHIRNARTWEPAIGRVLRDMMPRRAGAIFLDIGANVGYFTRLIANEFPDAIIHAFEPHPLTYQVLRMNTWQFGERVRAWPVALFDSRGTLALATSENNLGDTKGVHAQDGMTASVVVPSMPLDELLDGFRVDLVKIDVQGGELAVLQGMESIIHNSEGIRIVMEFSPARLQANRVDLGGVLDSIRGFGFDLNLIQGDSLFSASNTEIIEFCYSAGPLGEANLLLVSKP